MSTTACCSPPTRACPGAATRSAAHWPRWTSSCNVTRPRTASATRCSGSPPRAHPPGNDRGAALDLSARASRFRRSSVPDLPGGLDDQAQLGDLLVVAEHVALDGGGEAALRREAELLERDELGGVVDAPLEVNVRSEERRVGKECRYR